VTNVDTTCSTVARHARRPRPPTGGGRHAHAVVAARQKAVESHSRTAADLSAKGRLRRAQRPHSRAVQARPRHSPVRPQHPNLPVTSGSRRSGRRQSSSFALWPLTGRLTSHFGYRWGKLHAASTSRRPRPADPLPQGRGRSCSRSYNGYCNSWSSTTAAAFLRFYGHQSRHRFARGTRRPGPVIGFARPRRATPRHHGHFETRESTANANPRKYLPLSLVLSRWGQMVKRLLAGLLRAVGDAADIAVSELVRRSNGGLAALYPGCACATRRSPPMAHHRVNRVTSSRRLSALRRAVAAGFVDRGRGADGDHRGLFRWGPRSCAPCPTRPPWLVRARQHRRRRRGRQR